MGFVITAGNFIRYNVGWSSASGGQYTFTNVSLGTDSFSITNSPANLQTARAQIIRSGSSPFGNPVTDLDDIFKINNYSSTPQTLLCDQFGNFNVSRSTGKYTPNVTTFQVQAVDLDIDNNVLSYATYNNVTISNINLPATATAPTLSASGSLASGGIVLTWNDTVGAGTGNGYGVYRSTDNINFTLITNLAENVNTYTDTSISLNTTYYYYVQAYTGTNFSTANSNTVEESVSKTAPILDSLTNDLCNETTLLSWTITSASDTYKVQRSLDNINWINVITGLPSGTTSYTTLLPINELRYYRVVGELITETPSNVLSTTNTFNAPSLSGTTSNQFINLSWSDSNSCSGGYQIRRRLNPAGSWTVIANLPSSDSTYQDSPPLNDTIYDYEIRSLANTNYSDYSNTISLSGIYYEVNALAYNFGFISLDSIELSYEILINNLSNQTLEFTFNDSTDFNFSGVTSISIASGTTSGVTIYAETDNLGAHVDNIDFNQVDVGGFVFQASSNIVTSSFSLSNNPLNFGTVEYGATGGTQTSSLISGNNNELTITFPSNTNFSITDQTSPIALTSGSTVDFTVEYDNAFTTPLGTQNSSITFFGGSGGTQTLDLIVNTILFPPVNLTGSSASNSIFLTWDDGSVDANIDGYLVYRNDVLIATINGNFTNYTDTFSPLSEGIFTYKIKSFITFIGESDFSSEVSIQLNSVRVQDFCSRPFNEKYSVINETFCNAGNGIFKIESYPEYSTFYLFNLTDADGNDYGQPDGNGEYTGLSANYYFIKAIPISNQLRVDCQEDWVILGDLNIYSVTGTTLSAAVCGGFNNTGGRAILQTDIVSPFDYKLYNENRFLVREEFNVTVDIVESPNEGDIVINELQAGKYYINVQVDDGCNLFYSFVIPESISGLSVPNIKKLFITEYSQNIDFNFWSTANDPDYFPSLDTLEFQSTKISNYQAGLTWYSIEIDELNTSFTQTLSKVRQGFLFNDVLTIGVPKNDTEKWSALSNLLDKSWIVIFQDNNDNWWTYGFENGATAINYTFGSELAGFTLGLSAISKNKLVSAIDENWVAANVDFIDNYAITTNTNQINFQTVGAQETPPNQLLTITNIGNLPIEILPSGTSGYSVVGILSPFTLQVGQQIFLEVAFTPEIIGNNVGQINISSDNLTNDVIVNCNTTVTSCINWNLGFSDTSTSILDFGNVLQNSSKTISGIMISNGCSGALSLSTTGNTNGLSTNPSSLTIAPFGLSNAFNITFNSTGYARGIYIINLQFFDSNNIFPTQQLPVRITVR